MVAMRIGPVIATFVALTTAGCLGASGEEVPAAYQGGTPVPTLDAAPKLDGVARSDEWQEATALSGSFVISAGSVADGHYPFWLRIGQTKENLWVAITMPHVPPNPYDGPSPRGSGVAHYADVLSLLLDQGESATFGGLADQKALAHIPPGKSGFTNYSDRYRDLEGTWNSQGKSDGPVSLPGPNGELQGRESYAIGFDGTTRTFELAIAKLPGNSEFNKMDMAARPWIRIALSFERGGGADSFNEPGEYATVRDWDVWPAEGYSRQAVEAPSQWLHLRLDG